MTTARRLAVLAVAVILLACREEGIRPTATVQAADTADQVLVGVAHYITEAGVRRSLVEADTAYMYESGQTAELRNLTVTFYDAAGTVTSTITAREGTYIWQSGDMTARKDVVGSSPDGGRLRTSVLRYDPRARQITSDQFFTFDRAGDHLEGAGFTSDTEFRNVVVTRPRGTEGGTRLLPGQE